MARVDQLRLRATAPLLPVSGAGGRLPRVHGLPTCAALAAALHLGLLTLSGGPTSLPMVRRPAATTVSVRLQASTALPVREAVLRPPPQADGTDPSAALPPFAAASTAAEAATASAAEDVAAAPAVPAPVAMAGLPDAAADIAPGGDHGFDAYLPTSILTLAPAPSAPIDIPYPPFNGDAGRYLTQLTLFIDEAGLVQRIDIGLGDLPPILEAAVRHSFMAARFRPGEVDGVAVRSRVRIEVRFDSGLPRR